MAIRERRTVECCIGFSKEWAPFYLFILSEVCWLLARVSFYSTCICFTWSVARLDQVILLLWPYSSLTQYLWRDRGTDWIYWMQPRPEWVTRHQPQLRQHLLERCRQQTATTVSDLTEVCDSLSLSPELCPRQPDELLTHRSIFSSVICSQPT